MDAAFVNAKTHRAWRYAQEKSGQKLHIVEMFADQTVATRAECGRQVQRWRMSINVPLAHACRNCLRVMGR